MKKTILIALAATAFASCVKNAEQPAQQTAPTFKMTITASDKDDDQDSATRAEMVNGAYHWSVGDVVGLTVTPAGSTTGIINNLPMTGDHTAAVKSSTFTGELTLAEISQLNPNNLYDYYTYFPYQSGTTIALPNMTFPIPGIITVQKNLFPSQYAPMVGTPVKNETPVTWLEGEKQQRREHIGFNYKHIMSYICLQLEINLMSQPITRVSMTNNQGTIMSGTMNIDLNTGAYGFASTGSSTQLIVNVSGGFDVGDKIYFPVPPGNYTGQTFTMRFTTASGNVYEKTISGGNFQRGKIHNVTFKIPFIVDFSTTMSVGDWVGNGKKGSFSYKGWTFAGDGNYYVDGDVLLFKNGASGMILSPALNCTTLSGRTSIPVILKIYGHGADPTSGNRKLYYKAAASSYNSSSSFSDNNLTLPYNQLSTSHFEWVSSGSFNINSATPCVAMYHSPWGAYNSRIRAIEIWPNY